MSEEKEYRLKVKLGLKLKAPLDLKAMLKWFQESVEIEEVAVEEEPAQ